ncbi:hypothetical protein DSM110093_02948 [Sulfitobacter sp. DSM 110093]|uniref:tripartite tricarboxylate transporter TctB family protein n=1 Tax=Sulfitobacter sp. DSM 110093 TaxID=2883127 RepID=UPI001FAE71FD|nr:tripartite tricarboxylate transporter TctB family protein [Sulfitobacter sp. DSM 110093]UOA33136.1 hypothetical protein DSM110093_02948 [Sulfitobacter sp. DSM 110093]
MTQTLRDRLIASTLILLSLLAIWVALDFRGDGYVFPMAMAGLLAVVCLLKLILPGENPDIEKEELESINWNRFLLWSVFAVLFYILAEPLGVFIVIPAFMFAVLKFLAHLKITTAALIAVLFTATIFFVFELLLEVPTPVGILDGIIR